MYITLGGDFNFYRSHHSQGCVQHFHVIEIGSLNIFQHQEILVLPTVQRMLETGKQGSIKQRLSALGTKNTPQVHSFFLAKMLIKQRKQTSSTWIHYEKY